MQQQAVNIHRAGENAPERNAMQPLEIPGRQQPRKEVGDVLPSFLEGLNKKQLDAATATEGPLLILAGAGSGKTKTLIARVAYLVHSGVRPESILLLTFTRKAADEMRERAAAMLEGEGCNIRACTFHSFCASELFKRPWIAGLGDGFEVLLNEADAVNMVKVSLGMQDIKGIPPAKEIVRCISESVNKGIPLKTALRPRYEPYADEVAKIARELKRYKEENNKLNYDDILIKFRDCLKSSPGFREMMENSYEYIMVDEYQDTNAPQDEILSLMRQDNKNLAVVGDDMQSIYAFRGAVVENIMTFPERFPGCRVVKLEDNYRSTQEILDVANGVTEMATEGFAKTLRARRGKGAKPSLLTPYDEAEETAQAVDVAKGLHALGTPLREICLLARQSRILVQTEARLDRDGVPYEIRGGTRFMDKECVLDVFAFLKLCAAPKDELSWFRVLQMLEGVGSVYAMRISAECKASGYGGLRREVKAHGNRKYAGPLKELYLAFEKWNSLSFDESFPLVTEYYLGKREAMAEGYRKKSESTRLKELDKLERDRKDLEILSELARGYTDLGEFLDDFLLETPAPAGEGDKLILSTVHSAKGLEFGTVVLMDCAEPFNSPEPGSKEDNEELRCMYVAVTRAKDSLVCLWPQTKIFKGRAMYTDPPRHIDFSGMRQYASAEAYLREASCFPA